MPQPRRNIRKLHAYIPGEQPGFRDTDDGLLGGQGILKLNTNENPYPPSPAALQAIRELPAEALRLYPPATATLFRETAASLHELTPKHVIATNGGDELLRLLITTYCRAVPEDATDDHGRGGIGTTKPSYTLYRTLAEIHPTPVTVVQRVGDGFELPEDYADQLNAAGCAVAFLVNPHAPTGRFEPIERVRALAERFEGLLVVDEAYVDFAPDNALPLVRDGLSNVLILRSLSKGYGLAGLRFGYGLGHPDIIATLDKARDSYNTDILSQAAAVAALRDRDHYEQCRRDVLHNRGVLTDRLRRRGFGVPDSHANFVLATVPADQNQEPALVARHLYERLKQENILVRYFDQPPLDDKLRITVGSAEQNALLIQTIDGILAHIH